MTENPTGNEANCRAVTWWTPDCGALHIGSGEMTATCPDGEPSDAGPVQ